MRLENVAVGEAYLLKVGRNAVQVTVKGMDAHGKISVATAAGKTITVADAARLTPQAAKGAKTNAAAPKPTKRASGRNVAQKGAPRGEEGKKIGLLDAAIVVLRETGTPMNVREMVEAVLAKKLWATTGKTPASTLYAAVLREIQQKGVEARFVKTDRGKFALKG